MTPTISVVIPMRDGARYVSAALDSIAGQDLPVTDVVVVDDGSTDDGPRVAAGHPLRPQVASIPASGIGAARNRGIVAVRSEYIAFLDSDDLWPTDHCRVLLEPLLRDPGLAMAFGHAAEFASPDIPTAEQAMMHIPAAPMPAIVSGAMLARRSVFERVGLFDPELRVGEFIHWLLRASDAGERHVVLPDVVLRRRHHPGNIGRVRGDDRRIDYVRAIRDHMLRRRAAAGRDPAP